MTRLKTTASIILNVEAEQINELEVAEILFTIEQQLNSVERLVVNGTRVGLRIHINDNIPKQSEL